MYPFSSFKVHLHSHKLSRMETPENEQKHRCRVCNDEFDFITQLLQHLKDHIKTANKIDSSIDQAT